MKVKVIIKGRVHGVGYRVKLINLALEYGIDRFSTFNTKIDGKEAVICLIDAPDRIVEEIKGRIHAERPEKAIVESVEFKDYPHTVPPIERTMQAFQMEHWGKAIPVLLEIRDSVREESKRTRDELGSKIDSVGEKVDRVAEKVDSVGEKVDLARKDMGGKIDLLRSDLKEYIEVNFKRLSEEMGEVKRDLEKLKEALRKAGISI